MAVLNPTMFLQRNFAILTKKRHFFKENPTYKTSCQISLSRKCNFSLKKVKSFSKPKLNYNLL